MSEEYLIKTAHGSNIKVHFSPEREIEPGIVEGTCCVTGYANSISKPVNLTAKGFRPEKYSKIAVMVDGQDTDGYHLFKTELVISVTKLEVE